MLASHGISECMCVWDRKQALGGHKWVEASFNPLFLLPVEMYNLNLF